MAADPRFIVLLLAIIVNMVLIVNFRYVIDSSIITVNHHYVVAVVARCEFRCVRAGPRTKQPRAAHRDLRVTAV